MHRINLDVLVDFNIVLNDFNVISILKKTFLHFIDTNANTLTIKQYFKNTHYFLIFFLPGAFSVGSIYHSLVLTSNKKNHRSSESFIPVNLNTEYHNSSSV